MLMLKIMAEALGQVIGGLVAAALFCWLFWNAFKLVRHPEISAALCVLVAVLVWVFGISSPLVRLTSVYAAMFALWLWPAGLSWRREHPWMRRN